MSESTAPIGIFDSGLGGLTVLRQVTRILPAERVIYYADTANVPYGDKPVAVVRELAMQLTERLVAAGAKIVIMASGTSTVAGLEAAREAFPNIPIVGTIEAGALAAVRLPGPIGVLATEVTVRSQAFTRAIGRHDPNRVVIEHGCPLFVPLVESGRAGTSEAVEAARRYLHPLIAENVGSVILGCTHFPFLLSALHDALGDSPARPIFVDPAEEAVREASELLESRYLAAAGDAKASVSFFATGDPHDFAKQAQKLLGGELPSVAALSLPGVRK